MVLSLGTRCPPRVPSLLVSCSPVPHHVVLEGPLEVHCRKHYRTKNPHLPNGFGEMGIVYLLWLSFPFGI